MVVRAAGSDRSTSRLGDWYVNVLFWKPQVAVFVSEATLLPVPMPFASARTLLDHFVCVLLAYVQAHGIGRSFTEPELAEMELRRFAQTASRSLVETMNEFAYSPAFTPRWTAGPISSPCRCGSQRRRADRSSSDRSVPNRELAAVVASTAD